jgi:nitrogen regulatory protein P-II 2
MNTVSLKRVTIIAEALLEARLLADLERLGAKGFTIVEPEAEVRVACGPASGRGRI